ncbi:MAG: DUF1699 family protein [ANME-2 cluster archaeon]|nr:MAG: DUF1699 family protein [ANME-2 cluster archaeon]
MKMVIGNPDTLIHVNSHVKQVHITFRPSEKAIFRLINKCPGLESVQIPASHMKSISNTTKSILELRGITLSEGSTRDTERYIQ